MQFLFIKVMEKSYKNDIFLALQSVEINKASYYEAQNLDAVFTDEIPILKGLFSSKDKEDRKILIITAVVESKKQVEDFIRILEESGIDIKNNEIIRLMTMPIDFYFEPDFNK